MEWMESQRVWLYILNQLYSQSRTNDEEAAREREKTQKNIGSRIARDRGVLFLSVWLCLTMTERLTAALPGWLIPSTRLYHFLFSFPSLSFSFTHSYFSHSWVLMLCFMYILSFRLKVDDQDDDEHDFSCVYTLLALYTKQTEMRRRNVHLVHCITHNSSS